MELQEFSTPEMRKEALRYLSAKKEGRLFMLQKSRSSRTLTAKVSVYECTKAANYDGYTYLNFSHFLKCLGFKVSADYTTIYEHGGDFERQVETKLRSKGILTSDELTEAHSYIVQKLC